MIVLENASAGGGKHRRYCCRGRSAFSPAYLKEEGDRAAKKQDGQKSGSQQLKGIPHFTIHIQGGDNRVDWFDHQNVIEVRIKRGFQISSHRKTVRLDPPESHLIHIPAFHASPVCSDQGEPKGESQSTNQKGSLLGPDEGEDGWVDVLMVDDSENSILKFLPSEHVSLWNPSTQRINFKQLKVGAKIDIRYDFILNTDTNSTEAWIRTFIPQVESPTGYIGMLKYRYPYEMSFNQTLYIDIAKIRSEGAIIQARTDNEASIILKGMYISIS